jgi:hypothetical protein
VRGLAFQRLLDSPTCPDGLANAFGLRPSGSTGEVPNALDIAANSVPASALATTIGRVNDIRLSGPQNTDRFQVISQNLSIYTSCFTPAAGGTKFVRFTNRSQATATLNWFFSNGSTVAANGTFLGPGSERDFGFGGGRIEGQFIFSTPGEMITVNLHTFDAGDRCEVHGTAQTKLG